MQPRGKESADSGSSGEDGLLEQYQEGGFFKERHLSFSDQHLTGRFLVPHVGPDTWVACG